MRQGDMAEALENIANAHLAAEFGDGLEMGAFILADVPELATPLAEAAAVLAGLPNLADYLAQFRDPGSRPVVPSAQMVDGILRRNPVPRPALAEKFRDQLTKRLFDDYDQKIREYEKQKAIQKHMAENYRPDPAGYLAFLAAQNLQIKSFLFEKSRVLPVPEEQRKRHTYVTGRTGSGKSEALKLLIFEYVKRRTNTAVVIIDPASNFSTQVAKWREFEENDRLVFIDPNLHPEYTPVFNPLDIPESDRSNPKTIARLVESLVDTFQAIGESRLTNNMELALAVGLTVLFHKPGSSIEDLLDLWGQEETGKTAQWLDFARKLPLSKFYHTYLGDAYFSKGTNETKAALTTRFVRFFGSQPDFARMVTGKSTFNLESLVHQKKVVVIRLPKDEGAGSARAIGKFIIARMASIALRQRKREKAEQTTIHLFIDEFHNFISPTLDYILKELRQFNLHLTIAQQILGADMDTDMKRNILGNTGVKITGENEQSTLNTIAAETQAPIEMLESMARRNTAKRRYFHIYAGKPPGVVVEVPDHLVDDKNGVDAQTWERRVQAQLSRYYRRNDEMAEPAHAPGGRGDFAAGMAGRPHKRGKTTGPAAMPDGFTADQLKI
jgi:Helicase HerA, central domain